MPVQWMKIEALFYKIFRKRKSLFEAAILIGFLFFNSATVLAQNNKLNYKVVFNDSDIGWLHLEKNIVGNKLNILLTSEIKTRIIFSITVFSKEQSIFENGKLIFSSQFRKTNGSTKADKQIKLVGDKYEVFDQGERKSLKLPLIDVNLLHLYFEEPTSLKPVFWEKKNCFINVTKTDDGGYQMKFSNGNSNRFYYKNGVCTKVKIEHMFYSAEIVYVN